MVSKKIVAMACFLFLAANLMALTDEVAQISNIDKVYNAKKPNDPTVNITRNSRAIPDADIDYGFAIQNFDQIRTGAGSSVELKTNPKTGINATIVVQANTVMSFDITGLKANQGGGLNLLAGSVALKVQKLSGNNKLDIRTGTAVMGVRGTQFEVSIAVTGDILLSTSEGRVECSTEDGKTLFSAPGSVVQGLSGGEWSAIPVAADKLADFRKKWHTQRIDAFKADPARATAQFAKRYLAAKDGFNKAFAALMENRDVIQKWIEEDFAGNIGESKQAIVEKKRMIASLVALRKLSVMFERVYLRLVQLEELYAQGIAPTGSIPGTKLTVAAFYQQFRAERADLAKKFQDLQYITKLYAKRNGGDFPLDQAGSAEMQDNGAFFGDNGSGGTEEDFFNN